MEGFGELEQQRDVGGNPAELHGDIDRLERRSGHEDAAEQRQEKWASHVVTRLQSMRNNGAEDDGNRLSPAALSNSVLTARFPSSPSATEYSFT